MKTKMKKYPILITTIISCLTIIVSLFILGFFGLKLGVSLGGGQQLEVVMADDGTRASYTSKIDTVMDKYGYSIDTSFVEDKFVAGEENTQFSRKCLVIQFTGDIDEETISKIESEIAQSLEISENYVTIGAITSSVVAKNALFLGLSLVIVAVCFFVFGWIRYDIFAGLSFIIAYLHNIILYLSVIILTRIELSLTSLSAVLFLSLIMSLVLVNIYEKFRLANKQQDTDKTPIQEKMLQSEKSVIKPFLIICVAILIFVLCLFFIPSLRIRIVALNIIVALIVTLYTSLLIGPSSYVALLEIREMNRKAIMSRNDTVNKAIKKKIKRSKELKAGEK